MNKALLALTLWFVFLPTQQFALAEMIEWNYNGKATASGTGCTAQDTFFISAGDEVSIIFSNLGVELDGYQQGELEQRKFCRIKIPASIKPGYYLKDLSSSLLYGLVRSRGATAEVELQYRFLGAKYFRSQKYLKNRRKSDNIPIAELRDKRPIRNQQRCARRGFRSIMLARATVMASRDTVEDGVVVHLDGLSLRLNARASMFACRTLNPKRKKVIEH